MTDSVPKEYIYNDSVLTLLTWGHSEQWDTSEKKISLAVRSTDRPEILHTRSRRQDAQTAKTEF